jgi:hypothetical protein
MDNFVILLTIIDVNLNIFFLDKYTFLIFFQLINNIQSLIVIKYNLCIIRK